MILPGHSIRFSEISSKEEIWAEQSLKSKFFDLSVLIIVPLAAPASFLWIFRFKDMGVMNLSIEDFASAICALQVSLIARNWGKPSKTNGGFVAAVAWVFLIVGVVVLVACDSSPQMSELITFSSTNLCDSRKISGILDEIARRSNLFYVIVCFFGTIPAILETCIIFTGDK